MAFKSRASEAEVIPPSDKAKLSDVVGDMKDVTDTPIDMNNNPPNDAGTDVALPGSGGALSTEMADEFMGDTGMENVSSRDLLIPRLTILQALSPQLNARKPEYIKEAKLGQFCDTALGDVYNEMILIPVYYASIALEWAPRDTGKGLIANHGKWNEQFIRNELKAVQDEKRRWKHGDNLIAETATFYCLNITAGGRRSFVPLTSTNIKAARKWLTLITNERVTNPRDGKEFQPPIFYRSWKTSATAESNSQGDWFGWKFDPGQTILELDPKKNLLNEAKDFMIQARAGIVTGDLASFADDGTAGHDPGNQGNQNGEDRAM